MTNSISAVRRALFAVATIMALATGAAAQDCDPDELVATTTPSPPQSGELVRWAKVRAETVPDQADIVIVGDSIAQNWPAEQLAAQFPQRSVFNFGLGADKTQNILWRIANSPRLANLRPKMVVLILGTNNLFLGVDACAIAVGIETVASELTALWPDVELVVFPVLPKGFLFTAYTGEIDLINRKLRTDLSGIARVPQLDDRLICGITPAEARRIVQRLPDLADLWPVCGNYTPDWGHLTPPGYLVLGSYLGGLDD